MFTECKILMVTVVFGAISLYSVQNTLHFEVMKSKAYNKNQNAPFVQEVELSFYRMLA